MDYYEKERMGVLASKLITKKNDFQDFHKYLTKETNIDISVFKDIVLLYRESTSDSSFRNIDKHVKLLANIVLNTSNREVIKKRNLSKYEAEYAHKDYSEAVYKEKLRRANDLNNIRIHLNKDRYLPNVIKELYPKEENKHLYEYANSHKTVERVRNIIRWSGILKHIAGHNFGEGRSKVTRFKLTTVEVMNPKLFKNLPLEKGLLLVSFLTPDIVRDQILVNYDWKDLRSQPSFIAKDIRWGKKKKIIQATIKKVGTKKGKKLTEKDFNVAKNIGYVPELNTKWPESYDNIFNFHRTFTHHEHSQGRYQTAFHYISKENRHNLIKHYDYKELDLSASMPNILYYYENNKFIKGRFYNNIFEEVLINKEYNKTGIKHTPKEIRDMYKYEIEFLSEKFKRTIISLFNSKNRGNVVSQFNGIAYDCGLSISLKDELFKIHKNHNFLYDLIKFNDISTILGISRSLRNDKVRILNKNNKYKNVDFKKYSFSLTSIETAIKKLYPSLINYMYTQNCHETTYIEAEAMGKLSSKLPKGIMPLFVHDALYVPKNLVKQFKKMQMQYLAEEVVKYKRYRMESLLIEKDFKTSFEKVNRFRLSPTGNPVKNTSLKAYTKKTLKDYRYEIQFLKLRDSNNRALSIRDLRSIVKNKNIKEIISKLNPKVNGHIKSLVAKIYGKTLQDNVDSILKLIDSILYNSNDITFPVYSNIIIKVNNNGGVPFYNLQKFIKKVSGSNSRFNPSSPCSLLRSNYGYLQITESVGNTRVRGRPPDN